MIHVASHISKIRNAMSKDRWMTASEISKECNGSMTSITVANLLWRYGDEIGVETHDLKTRKQYRLTGTPKLDDVSVRIIETIKENEWISAKRITDILGLKYPNIVGHQISTLSKDYPIEKKKEKRIYVYRWNE